MKDSEMIIRKDMINDFKNRIEKQLEDAVQYNHTQEDLWYLKWQVIGLCDTFGLITHKEAEKFVGRIEKIGSMNNLEIIEPGKENKLVEV